MDESLKELLDAESEAERIVLEGEKQRDQIIDQATQDGRALEQQFLDRVPELHQSFGDKADERAVQSIAEIKLRYDERNNDLRELAAQHSRDAVDDALRVILAEDEPA
jgi:vacuolar-type H+-ATPase subunit H